MGIWAGEVCPTQLERQSVSSQGTGWSWGDGVFIDDKGGLTIVLEGGDRYVGQSATLERVLTTEILQCLVKGRVEC